MEVAKSRAEFPPQELYFQVLDRPTITLEQDRINKTSARPLVSRELVVENSAHSWRKW